MDKAKSLNDGWELPPLRGINDFLLESSRFQLPNFRDFGKWSNRIVNNLIYYQTNYLLTSLAIMLVITCLHPTKMFVGLLVMAMLYGVYGLKIMSALKEYPLGRIIMVVVSASVVIYTINSILLLLFNFLLSWCVIFVHASLRLRNFMNKIANKIEGMGLDRTPMGVFLKYFEDMIGISLSMQTTSVHSLYK